MLAACTGDADANAGHLSLEDYSTTRAIEENKMCSSKKDTVVME